MLDTTSTTKFYLFFLAISRASNTPWPPRHQEELKKCGDPSKIIKMDSERALLTFFLAKLSKIDPDMIIGHDICSYILSTLVNRLEANKIQNWSKIGRLRRTLFPKKVFYCEINLVLKKMFNDIYF